MSNILVDQELKEQTRKQIIAEKAHKIVDEGKVSKVAPNHWRVLSSDIRYPGLASNCGFDATLDVLTCSCPHYFHKAEYCKHLLSVSIWFGSEGSN